MHNLYKTKNYSLPTCRLHCSTETLFWVLQSIVRITTNTQHIIY